MWTHFNESTAGKIKGIDEALKKIDDKIYGRCEECDEKINKERLKILPFTKYCVNCQAVIEKRERHLGQSGEDAVVYKDVSINDIGVTDE